MSPTKYNAEEEKFRRTVTNLQKFLKFYLDFPKIAKLYLFEPIFSFLFVKVI